MIINLLNPIVVSGIPEDISDAEVIEKYLETSNSHYFDLLYDRHAKKVMAKCLSMLQDHSAAEDATQDIFVKILLKLDAFSGRSKFSTWLYAITYNYCIDLLRKHRKNPHVFVEDFSENDDIAEEIDDAELLETKISRLKFVLNELPPMDKSVLMMKYQDDMTIKEMSRVFDKSESAIKMKIKRAKEKFKRIHDQKYKTA